MKRILLALFLLGISAPAWATCSSYPYSLTNGTTADAGQVMANLNTVMNCVSQLPPQGRLTLTSNTPVMTADATAQSTVYYDCYVGSSVPIYNGTAITSFAIGSCETSLALNSSNQTSGNLYDVFAFTNSGTLSLCAGPAWSSGTTRSAAITISLGYWTNSSGLTHCYNGATDYGALSANQATYLGTFYATANGQTGMAFKPAPTAGGSAPILGLYNAYNRVRVTSLSQDNTSSWTYNSTTIRAANNSTANRVSWVDGLKQSAVEAIYQVWAQGNSVTYGYAGVGLDSTTSLGDIAGVNGMPAGFSTNIDGVTKIMPQLGFHYAQATEATSPNNTITWNGVNNSIQVSGITISLEM